MKRKNISHLLVLGFVLLMATACQDAKNNVEDWYLFTFEALELRDIEVEITQRTENTYNPNDDTNLIHVESFPDGLFVNERSDFSLIRLTGEEDVPFEDFRLSGRLFSYRAIDNKILERINPQADNNPSLEEELKTWFRAQYPTIIEKWKIMAEREYYTHEDRTHVYYSATCEVLQINIKSNTVFFGIPAGEPLNDYIVFDNERFNLSQQRYFTNYILSTGKYVIGNFSQIQTIDEYLSYNPLLNTLIYFRFKERPEELPAYAEITIEIRCRDTISGEEYMIVGSSPSIHLI